VTKASKLHLWLLLPQFMLVCVTIARQTLTYRLRVIVRRHCIARAWRCTAATGQEALKRNGIGTRGPLVKICCGPERRQFFGHGNINELIETCAFFSGHSLGFRFE
jgi:hypothetical protein